MRIIEQCWMYATNQQIAKNSILVTRSIHIIIAGRIRFGSVPNGSVESPVHAVPVHPVHCPYPVRAVPVHPVQAVQPVRFKAGSLGSVRFK